MSIEVLGSSDTRERIRDLRLQGKGPTEIARIMGMTPERVYAYCCEAFIGYSHPRAVAIERATQAARLERLIGVAMSVASDENEDVKVRLASIDQVVKIETRRAKLLGLDVQETILDVFEEKNEITPQMVAEAAKKRFGLVGPGVS